MLYIVNAGVSYWFSFTVSNKAAVTSQLQLLRKLKIFCMFLQALAVMKNTLV